MLSLLLVRERRPWLVPWLQNGRMLLLLLVERRRWLAHLGCGMVDGVDVAMIVGLQELPKLRLLLQWLLWLEGERRQRLAHLGCGRS